MSIDQADYFIEKHPWSETKDELLSCYLTPYFTKVYKPSSHGGIVYVDAFAGPGVFDDGSIGSPIIAIRKYKAVGDKQRSKTPISFIFAEQNYKCRNMLEQNAKRAIGESRYMKQSYIADDFNDAMDNVSCIRPVQNRRPSTYFYYVDPFGVKDLKLAPLLQSPNFMHTEALVNFNSIGFMRDGFSALKIAAVLPENVTVINAPFDAEIPTTERIMRLTEAIGSNEWLNILREYKQNNASFWETERRISSLFCTNARTKYTYVTNMPIKDMAMCRERGGLIKYRLVHMTNSAAGCILMNDNMVKRNDSHQFFQESLFKVDIEGHDLSTSEIAASMLSSVMRRRIGDRVSMGDLLAETISRFGVFDKSNSTLRTYLGPLIDKGLVERERKKTPTGRLCTSFNPKEVVYRTR